MSNYVGISELMRGAVSIDHDKLKSLLRNVDLSDLINVDNKGRTALDWARIKNDTIAVGLLTEAMNKAMSAARLGSVGVVESVESITRRRNAELTVALVNALDQRDANLALKVLVESYLSRELVCEVGKGELVYFADVTSIRGDSAILRACGFNMPNVVYELINLGANINGSNQYGHTPFTWSCVCGHADIVKILLAGGVDMYSRSREGKTGLHYACVYAKSRVVNAIFDHLSDQFSAFLPNEVPFKKYDIRRWTRYRDTVVDKLLNIKDNDGNTARDIVSLVASGSARFRLTEVELQKQEASMHQRANTTLDTIPPSSNANMPIDGMYWNGSLGDDNEEHSDDASHDDVPLAMCLECNQAGSGGNNVSGVHQPSGSGKHSSSVASAAVREEEMNLIQAAFDIFHHRLKYWKKCSDKEAELAMPVTCWNGCGFKAKFEVTALHVRSDCSCRPMVCESCHEVHPYHSFDHHKKQMCVKRKIACPNAWLGCRQYSSADYVDTHANLRCPYRLSYCRLQCNSRIPLIFRENHESNHCKKRLIQCFQCLQYMRSEIIPRHIKDSCTHRKVKCTVGCHGTFNIQDIENHERYECIQVCKWEGCGEMIGPRERRQYHELYTCLRRKVKCRNENCTVSNLIALNLANHESTYCAYASAKCPNMCGREVLRSSISQHIDSWYGDCPERFVRCPSNLLGWRVLVQGREGIVLKYERRDFTSESDGTGKLYSPDGVDMLYIRFSNSQEWVPYWTKDIFPLKLQKKTNSGSIPFDCGWIPYSQLNSHLHDNCGHRLVLLGGDVVKDTGLLHTSNRANKPTSFLGQIASVNTSTEMAERRVELDNFLSSKAVNPNCEYCAMEVPEALMQNHIQKLCTHYFVRCTLGCGMKKIRKQMQEHVTSECMKRTVYCPKCNDPMWFEEVEDHNADKCIFRIVPCRYKCSVVNLTCIDEAIHAVDTCEMRPYTCHCGAIFPICEKQDHDISICTKRLGLCPQGCGLIIAKDVVDHHMEHECKNKEVFMNQLVRCPLVCDKRMKRVDVLEHVTYFCPQRITECPYKCGNIYRYCKLHDHVILCPNRPLCCEKGMTSCKFNLSNWFCAPYDDADGKVAGDAEDMAEESEQEEKEKEDHFDENSVGLGSQITARSHKLKSQSLVNQSVSMLSGASFVGSGRMIQRSVVTSRSRNTLHKLSEYLDDGSSVGNRNEDEMSVASVGDNSVSSTASTSSISVVEGKVNFLEAVRMLSCPRHGRNLLMYAVRYDELELAELLIHKTRGEDLDVQNRYGDTAMTMACRAKNIRIVDLLINNGADVNMETVTGNTPLIQATKSGSIAIVEKLIAAGALVRFKTAKHSKSAGNWASILKLDELAIFLDIGALVQDQVLEIFQAISTGNIQRVREIVKDGDFFHPNNTTLYHDLLSKTVNEQKVSYEKLLRYLGEFTKVNDKYDHARKKHIAMAEQEDALKAALEQQQKNLVIPRKLISSRFDVYDQEACTLHAHDLQEISFLKAPDLGVRIALYAFALLFNVFDFNDAQEKYPFDQLSRWGPVALKSLMQFDTTLRNMTNFSWAAFESPHMNKLGNIIQDLYKKMKAEFVSRVGVLDPELKIQEKFQHVFGTMNVYEPSRVSQDQRSKLQQFLGKINMSPVVTSNKPSRGVVLVSPSPQKVKGGLSSLAVDEAKESDDESVVGGEGSDSDFDLMHQDDDPHEIPSECWDSDADEAGEGEWVKGEWVGRSVQHAQWWSEEAKQAAKERRKKRAVEKLRKSKKLQGKKITDRIVNVAEAIRIKLAEEAIDKASRPATAHDDAVVYKQKDKGETLALAAAKAVIDDSDPLNLPFIQCMYLLISAVAGLVSDRDSIQKSEEEIRVANIKYQRIKSERDALRENFNTERSRLMLFEKELNEERKLNKTLRARMQLYKEKYRVAILLNEVTASGHTVLSWAAASGCYEAVEELLTHGSSVGYNEEMMHKSARVIQCSVRLFLYHSQHAKRKAKEKLASMLEINGTGGIEYNDAEPGQHNVEEMFELKKTREDLIRNINQRRRRFRFAAPEAAYAGYPEIIKRMHFRRLLHFNFLGSWIFPSPPAPRPRVHRRLDYSTKKISIVDIVNASVDAFSSGLPVPGLGWVDKNHIKTAFQESRSELSELLNIVETQIKKFVDERHRIRILLQNEREQKIYFKEMTIAIKSADFKRAMNLALNDKCSIDFETVEGLTTLIVAAEENIGDLNHTYMLNDDGDPVLAVCYLVDRSHHAPAVNVETSRGITALMHACSLGRVNCVEALLDRAANINYQNKFGQTALHAAAKNGSARCVKLLLERGADSSIVDNEGFTPLEIALRDGLNDVIGQLSQLANGYLGDVQVTRGHVIDKISCPMGCGEYMYTVDVEAHMEFCVLREISCPLGCGNHRVVVKDLHEHLHVDCPHRDKECEKCHAIVRTCDFENHEARYCAHRLIPCELEGCTSMVPACEMAMHRSTCLYKLMVCPEHCGESYPIAKRFEHVRIHCMNRRVVCPLKCASLVVYRIMSQHMSDVCPCRPMACRFCNEVLLQKRWAQHERACDYRPVECKAKCGDMVKFVEMESHLANFCSHRFVQCELSCPQKVRVSDMKVHIENSCPNRLVPCLNNCMTHIGGVEVPLLVVHKQMSVHLKVDCAERLLKCSQCHETLKANQMEYHLNHECAWRMVACRVDGCMRTLKYKDREKHEKTECRHRLVICVVGCKNFIKSKLLTRHIEESCVMRYVTCPLGCGSSLRYNLMSSHIEFECTRGMSYRPNTSSSLASNGSVDTSATARRRSARRSYSSDDGKLQSRNSSSPSGRSVGSGDELAKSPDPSFSLSRSVSLASPSKSVSPSKFIISPSKFVISPSKLLISPSKSTGAKSAEAANSALTLSAPQRMVSSVSTANTANTVSTAGSKEEVSSVVKYKKMLKTRPSTGDLINDMRPSPSHQSRSDAMPAVIGNKRMSVSGGAGTGASTARKGSTLKGVVSESKKLPKL